VDCTSPVKRRPWPGSARRCRRRHALGRTTVAAFGRQSTPADPSHRFGGTPGGRREFAHVRASVASISHRPTTAGDGRTASRQTPPARGLQALSSTGNLPAKTPRAPQGAPRQRMRWAAYSRAGGKVSMKLCMPKRAAKAACSTAGSGNRCQFRAQHLPCEHRSVPKIYCCPRGLVE
jgi:hypothetical protein